MTFIAVHGGAGHFPSSCEKTVKEGLKKACIAGVKAGNAIEAVVHAITELEDDEAFNAGYGSNLTEDGDVECDAAIMNSWGGFGSIGAVSGIRNPVQLARLVLENAGNGGMDGMMARIPPMTLVSTGAEKFAKKHNPNLIVPAESLISKQAKDDWRTWLDRLESDSSCAPSPTEHEGGRPSTQDTVGAVSIGPDGSLAAAVSSGGILLKSPGRLGHAAIFGAGCWSEQLDNGLNIACSISGTGEAIIHCGLARKLRDLLTQPDPDVHETLSQVLESVSKRYSSAKAGILLITSQADVFSEHPEEKTRIWCAFTTPAMAIAWSTNGQVKTRIFRQNSLSNDGSKIAVCIYAMSA